MAPVLRLGPVGTHVSPSSRCPSPHASHMLSALHVVHPGTLHVTQPYPLPVSAFPSPQAVHFAEAIAPLDASDGAVHVLQPSTPTYALSPTVVPTGFPHLSTDCCLSVAPGTAKYLLLALGVSQTPAVVDALEHMRLPGG